MFFRTVVLSAAVLFAVFGDGVTEETNASLHFDTGSSPNSSPPSLSLNFAIGGVNLDLKLDQAPDLDQDVGVYLADSVDDKIVLTRVTTNSRLAMYQDQGHGAAFMLVTKTDSEGKTTRTLEGIVNKDGEAYHLETEVPSTAFSNDGHSLSETARHTTAGPDAPRNETRVRRDSDGPTIQLQFHVDKIQIPRAGDVVIRAETPMNSDGHSEAAKETGIRYKRDVIPGSRHKYHVTQDVYVDVVAMADYAVYSKWYSKSKERTYTAKHQDTMENLKKYYSFLFNMVDVIYKSVPKLSYKINVRLVDLIVSENKSSSPMTEVFRKLNPLTYEKDLVDGNLALTYLEYWVLLQRHPLPRHDHFMLFSGYDLRANGKDIVGISFKGTVCMTSGNETSVIEDMGTYDSVFTAAHELGHGLGAEHDSETTNTCKETDNYVMAPSDQLINEVDIWNFSTCSSDYFNEFITGMEPTLRESCLYQRITTATSDVTSQLPGQMYDAKKQCQLWHGPDSYFSEATLLRRKGAYSDLCEYLYCWDSDKIEYTPHRAAQGTTCGNKMWCVDGHCVYDSAAPSARVDGHWGWWGSWSSCSVTCGSGTRTRTRSCDNPLPQNGGHDCRGANNESVSCNNCRVDGQWGWWGSWSSCSVTCGSGTRARTRSCDNPFPQNGGHDCLGSNSDSISCYDSRICRVDGQWGWWGSWSSCSETKCGLGSVWRTRSCNNPATQNGGHDCLGENRESLSCHDWSDCASQTETSGSTSTESIWESRAMLRLLALVVSPFILLLGCYARYGCCNAVSKCKARIKKRDDQKRLITEEEGLAHSGDAE